MKRLLIPLILLIVLAIQGVAIEIAMSFSSMQHIYIIAHWLFVLLICISMFFDTDTSYFAIGYGVLFGLLIDVVYTDMLGIYMLGYGIALLIVQGIRKAFHVNIYTTMLMLVLGIVVADTFIHMIYSMVGIVTIPFWTYIWIRLLPTILANMIFLLLVYPFVSKRLIHLKEEFQEGT